MEVKPGIALPVVNNGLPQFEQKLRVVVVPLDARTAYVFGEPMTFTDCVGTITPEAKGDPLDC